MCGNCLKACSRKAINDDLELKSGFKINRQLCDDCGDCVKTCPTGALKLIGKEFSINEVMAEIKKDKYFYLTSSGGLTLSGGEPLYQFDFTRALLQRAYQENIGTAIETCGHIPWSHLEEVAPYLNTILYDIKHMDPTRHRQSTGVSNELILSNLIKLSKSGLPIVVRLPLIPQFCLDLDNMHETGKFISRLTNIVEVNLMPFHQLGKDKYRRLSLEYIHNNLCALDSSEEGRDIIREIVNILESYDLNVRVGG